MQEGKGNAVALGKVKVVLGAEKAKRDLGAVRKYLQKIAQGNRGEE
jgi:hypothetical protein